MKKKLVAMLMAALMAAALWTGCGDNTETNAPGPSESVPTPSSSITPSSVPSENNTPSSAVGPSEGVMVSDATFAILRENYALMAEYHDLVAAAYNSDEIKANPEIEEVMNQAADVIVRMGEIKQNMLTEEDAVELNELIIGIVDGLNEIVEAMEPAGVSGAEGTPVSDETFAILQENWTTLANFYNQVATAYNNGEIEKNEEFEKILKQAADMLEQIQNTSRADLTEEKAAEINNAMILIQDGLAEALGLTG